jgi:hypothetical protein
MRVVNKEQTRSVSAHDTYYGQCMRILGRSGYYMRVRYKNVEDSSNALLANLTDGSLVSISIDTEVYTMEGEVVLT